MATYAKSGTNWMMQIAHQLIWHGAGEFDHIHSVVPWPDTQMMGPLRRYAVPLQDARDWETSPERKRVIKTHFDWELLPYSQDARYIMVLRDPKDIFVSSYFFVRDGVLGAAMPSVDTWYKLFLSDGFLIGGSWAANTAGYWAQRHRPNVLIVSFKSMKRDLKTTVRKVARFLDIEAPEPLIDVVAGKSSFEYMKGIDHKFRMGKIIPWRPEGAMIRKGAQGGSSELLSRDAPEGNGCALHGRAQTAGLGFSVRRILRYRIAYPAYTIISSSFAFQYRREGSHARLGIRAVASE